MAPRPISIPDAITSNHPKNNIEAIVAVTDRTTAATPGTSIPALIPRTIPVPDEFVRDLDCQRLAIAYRHGVLSLSRGSIQLKVHALAQRTARATLEVATSYSATNAPSAAFAALLTAEEAMTDMALA